MAAVRLYGSVKMASNFTAREAATRYAKDESFAQEFDRALADLYEEQMQRLERIAQKLGIAAPPRAAERVPESVSQRPAVVTPDLVREVLRQNKESAMTRGEIALRLGVDNRDITLTRVLRILKNQSLIRQRGDRRAARYSAVPSRT